MSPTLRKATNKLIDMLDSGEIDAAQLAKGLLGYMSEADVADFAESEGYIEEETDEDDSDEDDEDRRFGQPNHGHDD